MKLQTQKRLRLAGVLLIGIGILYFLMVSLFYGVFEDVIRTEFAAEIAQDAELASGAEFIPFVMVAIGVVMGGGPLIAGIAVLVCARKPDKWLGCLVWGTLTAITAISVLAGELKSPTIATILPLLQLVLGVWVVFTALAIKKNNGVRKEAER